MTVKAKIVMVHLGGEEHAAIVTRDHRQGGEHEDHDHHLVDVMIFPSNGSGPLPMKEVRLFHSHSHAKEHHTEHGHAVAHLIND